jgi:hypothetical protein
VRPRPPPSLFELLEDGVVEGCVGETFGALLLTWQAERAEDPRVRRALAAIARDEARHAALAWEVWAWGAALLGARERAALLSTLDRALDALGRALPVAPPAVRRITGHPPLDVARRLACDLARLARAEVSRGAKAGGREA